MKSATDCCQMEQQIQQDAWCPARTARVCQQCLYENCPQIIEKEQRPPNNSKFEYHGNIMSGE